MTSPLRGAEAAAFSLPEATMPITVKDIMEEAAVVGQDDTVKEVARVMLRRRATCVAVVDPAGRLVGVIHDEEFSPRYRHFPFSTERGSQLFGEWIGPGQLEQGYAAGAAKRAREVMITGGSAVGEEALLSSVLPLLQQGRGVVVVREGRPIGMLTRHDLLKLVERGSPG